MIAYLRGKLKFVHDQTVVLEAAGVGYSLSVPRLGSDKIGDEVEFYVHMHWSPEKGPSLFGFGSEDERTVFQMVIGCSGIGPRIAVALLGQMTAVDFLLAVQSGNDKALSSVNGIGIKKAEQMVVQLRDKASRLIESGVVSSDGSLEGWQKVSEVLVSLNYSRGEIANAMGYIRQQHAGKGSSFDELMRSALLFLSKNV